MGLFTGLFASIISGCISGFIETKHQDKDSQTIITNQGIWRSTQKSVVTTLVTLIALIVIAACSNSFLPLSIVLGCIGLYVGGLSCLQHIILRTLLWQTNNAPWDYTNFLNYGTERLLTNRAGGGYLFMHDLLCINLANQESLVKVNRKPYSQSIILGIIIGIICLNSILIPTSINSWKVSSRQAILYDYHIKEGDRLITDLLFYRILKLKSANIINFKPIAEMSYPSERMINGEVLGCPGDTIIIKENKVIINEKILSNKYLKIPLDLSGYHFPNSIPNNAYLIIARNYGDNKNSLVMVPSSSIEEKVILRIWPTFRFI
jgi:Signal peptidase, peptidase S26